MRTPGSSEPGDLFSVLGVDWRPALDDLEGVGFAVFEFGLEGKLRREVQVHR